MNNKTKYLSSTFIFTFFIILLATSCNKLLSKYGMQSDTTASSQGSKKPMATASADEGEDKQGLLKIAILNANTEQLKRLIENGANPNGQDQDGNTPLYTALNYLQGKGVDTSQLTAIIKTLVEQGAYLDVPNKENEDATPYSLVRDYINNKKHTDICRWLLQCGRAKDYPLHFAIQNCLITSFNNLLQQCSSDQALASEINKKDGTGNTPLHLLLQTFSKLENLTVNDKKLFLSALELLLTHKEIDCTATDKDGNTPLHLMFQCQKNGLVPYIYTILKAGAKLSIKNNDESMPLQLLANNTELLWHMGILKGTENLSFIFIKKVLEEGVDINEQDTSGNTLLHIFLNQIAKKSHENCGLSCICQIIGTFVHAFVNSSSFLATNTCRAKLNGEPDYQEYLTPSKMIKANLNIVNNERETVLDLATKSKSERIIKILKRPDAGVKENTM